MTSPRPKYLQSFDLIYPDSCIWIWCGQFWSLVSRRHRLTYGEASTYYSTYSTWELIWPKAFGSYHIKTGSVDWISFLSTVAGFATISSSLTTFTTVALISLQTKFHKAPVQRNLQEHNFKIRLRSFRLIRRKAACSVRLSRTRQWPQRLRLSSVCWTLYPRPYPQTSFDDSALKVTDLHGLCARRCRFSLITTLSFI